MTVLLTGASGFVGRAVLDAAKQRGINVRPVFRTPDAANKHSGAVLVPGLDGEADWSQALQGVDAVIHAAARAHVMDEVALDSLTEYRRVNVQGTSNMARQAAAAAVRRFVFISSIKVNGEKTSIGRPFTAEDAPTPEDAYGLSKAEAETELRRIAEETGMEVTIIRPPLIYGPGVKGNFSSLVNWVRQGLPLPLGGLTYNRRSLVSLDNLVDLLLVCVEHPKAANQVFLVSDGEDVSTSTLLKKVAKAYGFKSRLFPMPVLLMQLFAELIGKSDLADRLFGDLQVDSSKAHQLLGWRPLITVDEQLRKMAELDIRDKNL